MIIEGEWRETSLAFIDFIKTNYNEDPYDYLKCMGYEIPYINNLKCGILYDYFKSYIELFRFLADIKSDINCLVFAPNINSKHRLTRAHREKQLKMSCQALHNAPPNRT